MKSSHQCPKCGSRRVGHMEHQWDSGDEGEAAKRPVGRMRWGGKVFGVFEPVGELEAYLCGDCGYFESYVKDPDSVDYDSLVGFRWLNEPPPKDGPYR